MIKQYDIAEDDREVFKTGLSRVKDIIDYTRGYQPNNNVIPGKIHLLRPNYGNERDTCGLLSVS